MALDLFKRVETRKGLFAVEKITLIYNLLTSILILFLFQEMDHPVQMLADRVVIAGMTFLLIPQSRPRVRVGGAVDVWRTACCMVL